MSKKIIFFVLSLFYLNGCASKKTITHEPTPPPTPEPTTSVTVPAGETPIPPPSEPPKSTSESIKITLVLGGAGVSSFATIGLIKRFNEEGIRIDRIVSTGWPTLFALGVGFSKSVHDLEWFSMKLTEKDFYKKGLFSGGDGYASQEALAKTLSNQFKQQDFSESKIPVIVSAGNTEGDGPDLFEGGDWLNPLLKTMSVPGIFRPYPQEKEWIQSLQGMDVSLARERGFNNIVAISMYDDYLNFIKTSKKDTSDGVFRKLYWVALKKNIDRELKQAEIFGSIQIGGSPTDFNNKRLAIFAGYKEGARLAKQIRSHYK